MRSIDPRREVDFSAVIADARMSLKKLEGSADRIKSIVTENNPSLEARKNERKHYFSLRFMTFAIVSLVACVGLLGSMLFYHVSSTNATIHQLEARVVALETAKLPSQSSAE